MISVEFSPIEFFAFSVSSMSKCFCIISLNFKTVSVSIPRDWKGKMTRRLFQTLRQTSFFAVHLGLLCTKVYLHGVKNRLFLLLSAYVHAHGHQIMANFAADMVLRLILFCPTMLNSLFLYTHRVKELDVTSSWLLSWSEHFVHTVQLKFVPNILHLWVGQDGAFQFVVHFVQGDLLLWEAPEFGSDCKIELKVVTNNVKETQFYTCGGVTTTHGRHGAHDSYSEIYKYVGAWLRSRQVTNKAKQTYWATYSPCLSGRSPWRVPNRIHPDSLDRRGFCRASCSLAWTRRPLWWHLCRSEASTWSLRVCSAQSSQEHASVDEKRNKNGSDPVNLVLFQHDCFEFQHAGPANHPAKDKVEQWCWQCHCIVVISVFGTRCLFNFTHGRFLVFENTCVVDAVLYVDFKTWGRDTLHSHALNFSFLSFQEVHDFVVAVVGEVHLGRIGWVKNCVNNKKHTKAVSP